MTTKLTVLLATLALTALGLAACGDDDSTSDSAATTEATSETTSETTAAGSGGAAETLEISADPGGELAYTTDELDSAAGSTEITFDNPSSTPHDVRIESSDGADLGGTEAITDSTATATVDLEPGTYTYYCSVDGHRAAGMEGTLNVK
jgi:plastocyanin